MSRILRALIDTAAIQHNLKRVRQLAPNSSVIAMVKANGYGHGLVSVAKSLFAADSLGVACVEEAVQLRQSGITQPILLMEGFFSAEELAEVCAQKIDSVIHSAYQLEIIEKHLKLPTRVWIKIDTGMNRLGFPIQDAQQAIIRLQANPKVKILGIMTHFAKADDLNSDMTAKQTTEFFKNIPAHFPKSLANSAGIIQWPDAHANWVRPGLMLYGISPISGKYGKDFDLRPAMHLQTNILAINNVNKDQTIGYTGRYKCNTDMRVGVIAVGYGDGYSRRIPDGTPVMVRGKKSPVVGCISMDMTTIDLTDNPEACIGDLVTLWGADLPVEDVAEHVGIIPYELVTSLGTRVKRQSL